MIGTRHEEYKQFENSVPFIINTDIKRDYYNRSRENNWHENLEIQFCTKGVGTVLLDGEKHPFYEGDIVVVNSNLLHYTGTETELVYDCLIISTNFCKQIGINPVTLLFEPFIKNPDVKNLFLKLKATYCDNSLNWRNAKLNQLVIELLILLAEKHSISSKPNMSDSKKFETVKNAIRHIREHYQTKITLDKIAKSVLCDKYTLCKDFKKFTGQTIFQNLNNYRCIKAIDCLEAGHSVAETAAMCGFENISFFTKTFKKYIGKLPSKYKQ